MIECWAIVRHYSFLMNDLLQHIQYIIVFLLAPVLVAGLLPVVRAYALQSGFVDKPGGRKKHDGDIPPVGGLVVFPVFMLLGLFLDLGKDVYIAFYAALALLLIVGAIDDRAHVAASIRFITQFIAALLIVVVGGAKLSHLGDVFGTGTFWLGFMALPFSVIAVVLLINAINLMDGLDGLAGGKGFIALFWLVICCVAQDSQTAGLMVVLMGTLFGFLVYNIRHPFRERASVFLGDAGSLALGLSLAWFSIYLGRGQSPIVAPMTVAWILALPIFDICGQFARRLKEGRHPFDADHDHFHHHFINVGLSVKQSTTIVLVIGFLFGAAGAAGYFLHVPEYLMAYTWIALLLAHIYMSIKPERFRSVITALLKSK